MRVLEAQRAQLRPLLGGLALHFMKTRCHETLGFRCLGDWARERIGVGARTVSEWARVWDGLGELPLLRQAVLDGDVSWTAARLVVGRVTSETEGACLETVRGRTVRAVKVLLAAANAVDEKDVPSDPVEPEEEQVRVRVECPSALQGKWQVALELARRMAGEALPTWACAEAIAAEVVSALSGAPDQEPAPGRDLQSAERRTAGTSPDPAFPDPGSRAPGSGEHGLRHVAWRHLSWKPIPVQPAKPPELDQLSSGLQDCTPHELDARFRRAIAFQQQLDLELGRILRQGVERRLYRELGFESFERYVTERLDLSPRTARRLVRLARAEHRAPEVANGFRQGRLTAFQAEVLLRVVTPGREQAWVARAQQVTLRRLEGEVPSTVEASVSFHAPREVAELFLATLRRVRRVFGGPAWVALERMLDHAITTWLEAGQQFEDYADFERDGYRCTVPGCTARRNLQSHHVRFRSAGGPDTPWNRTTLCASHHHRGVHAGRVHIRGRAPDRLLYELGTRQAAAPLLRFRSGDVLEAS
jgi:hypothetical protein